MDGQCNCYMPPKVPLKHKNNVIIYYCTHLSFHKKLVSPLATYFNEQHKSVLPAFGSFSRSSRF